MLGYFGQSSTKRPSGKYSHRSILGDLSLASSFSCNIRCSICIHACCLLHNRTDFGQNSFSIFVDPSFSLSPFSSNIQSFIDLASLFFFNNISLILYVLYSVFSSSRFLQSHEAILNRISFSLSKTDTLHKQVQSALSNRA